MKQFSLLFAVLLYASPVFAQSAGDLRYDYVGATPADVQTYTQSVRIDGNAVTAVPLCLLKSGSTTTTECSVMLPSLTSGAHAVVITATKNGVTRSTSASVATPDTTSGPVAPSNPRFTIIINVTVP